MPAHRFCRGREQRLRQLLRLPQTARQLDPADAPRGLILLPPRTREVAPHHALHGQRLCFQHNHRALRKLCGKGFQRRGEFANVRGNNMVFDRVKVRKPERRDRREHRAFLRNGIGQDAVEGAEAIRGDEQQVIAEVEDFAHFAAGDFADAGKVEGVDEHGK